MMASGPMGYLYVGVTNNLIRRVDEHKHAQVDGYSRDHGCDQLVWYEHHAYVDKAIYREKRIKRWERVWKCALVEERNPHWLDLYSDLLRDAGRLPDQP